MDNKKLYFGYKKDKEGKITITKIGTIENGTYHVENFVPEIHGDLFIDFLKKNDINGEVSAEELAEKGIFDEVNSTEEEIAKYIGDINNVEEVGSEKTETETETNKKEEETNETSSILDVFDEDDEYKDDLEERNTDFDDDDEYVDDNDKKDSKIGKRILAGALAAGAVAGGLALFHSCKEEQIIEEGKDKTMEDLLKEMTPEQQTFFKSSFDAVEAFNSNATRVGNFKLDKDTSALHMNVDEAIALNIILNDYSSDDLYEIFGTVEFDATNVMNLARSAYSKLSTYYMNAKEPSGLSAMINDESAREFFEKHENAVIEFNNSPSNELSDKVVKGLYYDYVVNGATGEYTKINNDGVAWLSTSAGFGFELANRNVEEFLRINNVSEEEISKYNDAAASIGLSLNEITTSEILTGINEKIDIDIMDDIDNKSLCASVTSQTRDKIDSLTLKQQIASTIIETNAKDELIEGLRESGNISLANKVLASEITPSLLEEISEFNSVTNELVVEYNSRISSLNNKEAKLMSLLNIAKENYNIKEEVDIASLVNNRFRSPLVVEKEPVVDTTPDVTTEEEKKEQLKEDLYVGEDEKGTPVYDGDKLNELPKEEKEQFIKDNGVVIDKQENVVSEVPVEEEDLTPEEVQQVVSEEAILTELEGLRNHLKEQGVRDGNIYTEEEGTYKYSDEIVIEWNSQKIDTENLTLAKIAQMAYAYENVEISVEDEQIQKRMDNDASKVQSEIDSLSNEAKDYLEDKYGSDWKEDFMDESYIDGYTGTVESTLKTAKEQGLILREETEKMYSELSQYFEKKNEVVEVKKPTNKPITVVGPGVSYVPSVRPNQNKNDGYDPNLDPNYGMADEIPYAPKIAEVNATGYYVSDSQLEDAFNDAIDGSTKAK